MKKSAALLAMIPICMMEFLAAQDFAVVNGVLGNIAEHFHVPVTQLHWVISVYLLTVGTLMVPGAIAGDRFGRKPVFVAGLALAAAGNICVFFANSFPIIVAARVLTGVGMALSAPVALALIADLMPDAAGRDRALSAISASQLLGLPGGGFFGGLIVSSFDWRFGFLLNVGVALLTIPLALNFLPKSQERPIKAETPLDVAGLILVAVASALLVLTVSLIAEKGLLRPDVAVGVLLSGTLIAAFVWVERRASQPILPLSLLRIPRFVRACALVALVTCLNTGMIFMLSLYLQRLGNSSSAMTGDVFGPMAMGALIGTWLIPRCVAYVSRLTVMVIGLAIEFLAVMCMALLIPDSYRFLPFIMGILGVSNLLILVPAQTQAFADVPSAYRGVASSLIRISYNLPTGIGVAMVAGALAAGGDRLALLTNAGFVLGAMVVFGVTRGPAGTAVPMQSAD